MLSASRFVAPVLRRTSAIRVGSISRRCLALESKLHSKERVEEDRYMRAQEEAWKEKLRQLKAEEEHARSEAFTQEVLEPVMSDVSKMLEASGDKVSDEGLMTLAKWKLDL